MQIELKRIGNSSGFIIPREVLVRKGWDQGEVLTLTETPTGLAISSSDESFQNGITIARRLMKRYRKTLAELAK